MISIIVSTETIHFIVKEILSVKEIQETSTLLRNANHAIYVLYSSTSPSLLQSYCWHQLSNLPKYVPMSQEHVFEDIILKHQLWVKVDVKLFK